MFTLFEVQARYQSQKESKVCLWLERISNRVVHYGAILDVFVQHHPEYVSLVWGTFKFLFTVSHVVFQGFDIGQIAGALFADSL